MSKHKKHVTKKATLRKNQRGGVQRIMKSRLFSKRNLIIFAVIFACIGGYIAFRTFATVQTIYTLEAETMSRPSKSSIINDGTAGAGKAMLLRIKSTTSKTVNVTDTTNQIIVRAKGKQCSGAPEMLIKVDGAIISRHSVKATSWANHTKNIAISPGNHNLSVSFINNKSLYTSSGKLRCTRDLYIDKIVFKADVTPPEEEPEEPPSPWQLLYEDNFDGSAVDTTKWNLYNGAGHAGNGLRRPSAFSTDGNGTLIVTAGMDSEDRIVSGGMSNKTSLTYGRYEARVRTEADPTGTMSGVILTWPVTNNYLIEGENDFYETGHAANTRTPFHSFIHWPNSPNSSYQTHFTHNADGTQWHIMAMEWSATSIKIFRDGTLIGEETNPARIPDVAHKLCVQLDAFSNTTTLTQPVRMYVDYVRVYTPL